MQILQLLPNMSLRWSKKTNLCRISRTVWLSSWKSFYKVVCSLYPFLKNKQTNNYLPLSLLLTCEIIFHLIAETKRFVALLFLVLEKDDYTLPVPAVLSQLASGETPSSTTEVETKIKQEPPTAPPPAPAPEPQPKQIPPPQVCAVLCLSLSLNFMFNQGSPESKSHLPVPFQSTSQPTVSSSTSASANSASAAPNNSSVASVVQVNGSAVNSGSAPGHSARTSHRKSDSVSNQFASFRIFSPSPHSILI